MLWQYASADSNSAKVQPSNSLWIGNPEYYLHPGDDLPSPGSADTNPLFRTTNQIHQLQSPNSKNIYGKVEQMTNNNYVAMETNPQNCNKPSPFHKEATYTNF